MKSNIELYEYYVIFQGKGTYDRTFTYVYTSTKPIVVDAVSNGYKFTSENCNYRCYYFMPSDSNAGNSGSWDKLANMSQTVAVLDWQLSSHDIYASNGDVFFYLPKPTALVQIAETITAKQILGQMIGLLPLLIVFLIGLVGFWKGWQFLLKILRRA